MSSDGALLLGKRTYEDLHGFWPSQTDSPYTDVLNKITKYVASTTMTEPLPWSNSVLLAGDAANAVAKMRRSEGPRSTPGTGGAMTGAGTATGLVTGAAGVTAGFT